MAQFPRMRLYLAGEELCLGEAGKVELSAIWRELREEVLESVLLRLPVVAICRFRAVCKSWRRLLGSSEFLERSTALALALRAPSFLLGLDAAWVSGNWWPEAYTPSFRHAYKAHNVDLDFLPEEASGFFVPSPEMDCRVYSESGLLCLAQKWGPHGPLLEENILTTWVVNVANKTWTKLPLLKRESLDGSRHKVTLEVTPPVPSADGEIGRCDFRVGVFWMEHGRAMWAVCSSNGGSWAIMRLQRPDAMRLGCFMSHPALLQGMVWVLFSRSGLDYESTKLLGFDAATGSHVCTWNAPQRLPRRMARSWQGQHICVHQGKIVWVLQSAPRQVDVWMMDFVTQTWIWLSALTDSRFFRPREKFCLQDAQTAGDMLYLAFKISLLTEWEDPLDTEGVFHSGSFHRAVLVGYHFSLNTWHRVAEDSRDISRNGGKVDRIVTGEWRPELYL